MQLEELIDQNMYYCGVCGVLREGMRQTVLRRAPRVLNLHLLRFVYERETMRKKKISSALQVPATLDATRFFSVNQHLHGSLDPNSHRCGEALHYAYILYIDCSSHRHFSLSAFHF